MVDVLYAFIGGERVGVFRRSSSIAAEFVYDDTDPDLEPLSLSLPRSPRVNKLKALIYLDNLLPDSKMTRDRLALALGTRPDVFDLLGTMGEDVGGAVSFSTDPDLPRRENPVQIEATDDAVAYRIATLSRDAAEPPPEWAGRRWSLAGMQGKFSLARIADRWFWPSYELPSTHIFKPAPQEHLDTDLAEHAMLQLAHDIGLPATTSALTSFKHQRTFMVRRWDRLNGARIHTEDLAQALGISADDKYSVPAERAAQFLTRHGQSWQFVRQLAFNVAIGNADAHSKNYSIVFHQGKTLLAPLYDVLPIFLWPQFKQTAAMPIGGAKTWDRIDENAWLRFAKQTRLDPERLLSEISPIFEAVHERLPDALRSLGPDAIDKAAEHVKSTPLLRRMTPSPRTSHGIHPSTSHSQHQDESHYQWT